MPGLTFPENFRVTTATTGTGTLTLGSAVAQYAGSSALVNGKIYPYTILDPNGTDWETGVGTYASSGTTLTRGPIAPNGNAAINISGAGATVGISLSGRQAQSNYAASRAHIVGEMVYVSATQIGYSAGSCFIESEDRVVDHPAPANITPTLAASTIYSLYGFLSSGTFTLEGPTTAPVPFASPIGQAQSKTGDNTRRYLGSFVTDASANIIPFAMYDQGAGRAEVRFTTFAAGAPYRISGAPSTATTYTALTVANLVPPSTFRVKMRLASTLATTGGSLGIQLSTDGANLSEDIQHTVPTATLFDVRTHWSAVAKVTGAPSLFYRLVAGGGGVAPQLYADVVAYEFRR